MTGNAPAAESVDRLERIAARMDAWLGAHRRLWLTTAALLSVFTFSGYAHAKFPWVDEVLELTIARLPGVRAIWAALMDGVQVDPPVLHTALHFMFRFFGESVFWARMPSILGFTAMCVALACLVWRHAPPMYAAATFFLPYATILRTWAMDVRPYGLMLGFSALALLCWDSLEDGRHRTAWRIGFIVCLGAALSTHFYSILLLLPLGLGELAKWVLRKRADWMTWFSIGVALIPYLFWSPILLSGARHFMKHYFYRAAFKNLSDFFGWAVASLPMATVLLLMIGAVAVLGRIPVDAAPWARLPKRQRSLLAAVAGFLLLPAVGFAAGVVATGFFVPNYHIVATFGIILGLPLVLAATTGNSRVVGACLLLAMLGHGLFVTARGLTGFVRREAPYPSLAAMRKLIVEPDPDIVVSSPMNFLPFYEANRRTNPENNLLYLYDAPKAYQDGGTDTSEIVLAELRGRTQARIEPFDPYVVAHPRFYMAVMGDVAGIQEWQVHYLQTRGHASFWWLGRVGDFDLYRVDAGGVKRSLPERSLEP